MTSTKDDGCFLNLGAAVVTSVCHENGITCNTEADSGFTLTILNTDSAEICFYNNSNDPVHPVSLTAMIGNKRIHTLETFDTFVLEGYADTPDGYYTVSVILSNGCCLIAGVCKTDGNIYAANIEPDHETAVERTAGQRELNTLLTKHGVSPENAANTDRIYYPIVPTLWTEKTDVKPWLKRSDNICEPNWTDAHKVYALYSWCVDNLAYDSWVIDISEKEQKSRWFYYDDFSGKYYTSQTHVGVCEDFAQILAIMCRQQDIPAVVIGTEIHAWNAVYLKDYDRWIAIDVTYDVKQEAEKEDTSNLTLYQENDKCESFDSTRGGTDATSVFIGNDADMTRLHIRNPYE